MGQAVGLLGDGQAVVNFVRHSESAVLEAESGKHGIRVNYSV